MWIELESADALAAERVGGKAAGIARLARAGLPVPRGWCLPVEAEPAAASHDLLTAVASGDEQVWRRPAALLRARLADAPPSDRLRAAVDGLCRHVSGMLAVRSSAVLESSAHPASLSGQLSTFLGVRGADSVLKAIQACWLSRWSDAAIRYALGRGLDLEHLRLGVLVQTMVPARAAGSALAQGEQVTVEATWGLGRGVAEAEVVPDRWLLVAGEIHDFRAGYKPLAAHIDEQHGETWQRLPVEMATTPCLDVSAVLALGGLIRQAAAVFGEAIEVEWAVDEPGNAWLLQARLFHAALRPKEGPPAGEPERTPETLDGVPASPGQGFGRARIVATPSDVPVLGPGDVLVARLLRPGALAGVTRLAGLVLEAGGTTSHAATLARERGIPAVLGARGATQRIVDGAEVLVDGDSGRVSFSARPAPPESGRGQARRLAGHPEPRVDHG